MMDIRQSDNWSRYQEMYGWKSLTLSQGHVLRFNSFLIFNTARLQRPKPLCDNDMDEINKVCTKNNIAFLKISPSHKQDISILKKHNYKETKNIEFPPTTMFIDLNKGLNTLWSNLSNGCRYSINRSGREGDYVEIFRNPEGDVVNNYYDIIQQRGRKKGYYVLSLRDHACKVSKFTNEAFIFNVYNKEGTPLGTKLFLGFNNNIWYMHGGITELGQKSKGNYKLLWQAISYFNNLGYNNMDIEGLDDVRLKKRTAKWKGYSHFKKRFKGTTVEFPLPHQKIFLKNIPYL